MESSSSAAAEKRKPRVPATPAEDAEVIALSPSTLTATSRFFCDVCRKGFQREQNLQLHRRSHNLPWELKQRTGKEPVKRVYVCPVPSCVHHDPAKALGDLSGIKKHFCRKHGEKKFNCHGCGKKYAVQSDVRAHMKVCGTKTHHCDCGALFTKWDNFARHKEYCDSLTQAIARHQQAANTSPPPPPSLTLSMGASSPVPSGRQSSEFPGSQSGYSHWKEETLPASAAAAASIIKLRVRDSPSTSSGNIKGGENEVFGGGPASSTPARQSLFSKSMASCSDVFCAPMEPTPPLSFLYPPHLAVNASSSQYVAAAATPPPAPALSATALLQKATQIGSTYNSGGSFLHGLGFSMLSDFNPQYNTVLARPMKWNGHAIPENTSMVSPGGSAGLPDSMLDRPSPATLDFLGVGGGNDNGNGNGDAPSFSEYFWDNPNNHL